jgi:hypothetical protein
VTARTVLGSVWEGVCVSRVRGALGWGRTVSKTGSRCLHRGVVVASRGHFSGIRVGYSCVLGCAVLCWAGLCWAGLGCAVLGCAGLGCAGLGCAVLGCAGLGCALLCWAVLGCAGLGWAGLCWAVLCCARSGVWVQRLVFSPNGSVAVVYRAVGERMEIVKVAKVIYCEKGKGLLVSKGFMFRFQKIIADRHYGKLVLY